MSERNFINKVLVLASQIGMRLSRNNTGTLKTERNTWVNFGVFSPGGSDLIGFTPILITPEMVGKTIAVFTALELKCGKTKSTISQKSFVRTVKENGGFAAFIHDDVTETELRALTKISA